MISPEKRDEILPARGGSRRLYVSRGVGTWGPPIRVLARPEITLFIIEPE